VSYIKTNVEKSISALKQNPQGTTQDAALSYISELERCLSILKHTPSGHSADPDLLTAKKIALDVLDSTRGKSLNATNGKSSTGNLGKEPPRQKMGLRKNYELSSEQYRKLELAKEDYMVNALKLKEDLDVKSKDDAAVLSDDEEDEDEGDASGEKTENESKPDVEMSDNAVETPAAQQKVSASASTSTSTTETNNHEVKPDISDSATK
jgi:hypothetical protein